MGYFRHLIRGGTGALLWLFLGGVSAVGVSAREDSARFSYQGWNGALRASNDVLEIVVLPQTGRLIHLSAPGKENFLTFNASLVGQLPPVEEGDWLNYGGDWMWVVHQDRWEAMGGNRWPPLRVLDRAHWSSEVEIDEKGTTHIRLRREVGAPVFVSIERHFELPAGDLAELTVHQSILRIQTSEIPVTLWQICQVKDAEQVMISASQDDVDGKGFTRIGFDSVGEDVLYECEEALVYHPKAGAEHKIGTQGDWIAARKQDQALLIWAEGGRGAGEQPDNGSTVVFYSNAGLGYSEIETQSEEVALAPGEFLQNTVQYRLVDVEKDVEVCKVVQKLNLIPPPKEPVSFRPQSPHPEDRIRIRVRTDEDGGVLLWGVNASEGNWELPDPMYWPEGTVIASKGKAVETPLPDSEKGYAVLEIGPFNLPEQVVTSVHWVVRGGPRRESLESQEYTLELVPQPDASEIQWIFPAEPLEKGTVNVEVGSVPAADEIRLYLEQREVAQVEGDTLVETFDAGPWSIGPHDLKVRAIRKGHVSTDTKRIWKLPLLKTRDPLPEETPYGASLTEAGHWRVYVFDAEAKFMEIEWQADGQEPHRELMQKTLDGHWVSELLFTAQDHFSYRFHLNGERHFADPWSKDVRWLPAAGESSESAEDAWTLVGYLPESPGEWTAPDPARWVLYEVHIPDIQPPGSFRELVETLDYMESLGVNALSPLGITTLFGDKSWGEPPVYPMAVERRYGSPEDFAVFIQEARERGIAFVADLGLNRIDVNAPFHGIPYLQDILEYWATFWRVDGFRYDAIPWVNGSEDQEGGIRWMSEVVNQANPDIIQLLAISPPEPDWVMGSEVDGELDGTFRWRMRKILVEGEIEEPEKIREILDPRNHAYQSGFQRVPYIESHAEMRFVRELLQKGYSAGEAFIRHEAAAAVMLTVPGIPMVYAGQEWGEMTSNEMGPPPLQWQLREQQARAELLRKFRELIHLRVDHPALHTDRIDVLHVDAENGTFAYLRPGVPESILVAVNVSKQGIVLELDVSGEVEAELFRRESPVHLNKLTLRPGQARIFRIRHPKEVQ